VTGNNASLDTTGFAPGTYTVWAHAVGQPAAGALGAGSAALTFDVTP
jgi:hypothetical protein